MLGMFKLPELGVLYKYVQLGQGDESQREIHMSICYS